MSLYTYLNKFIITNKSSIFSFLIVGLLTALFYLSFFSLLTYLCKLNYHTGVSIAYITSVILYFFAHRHFTFKNKDKAIKEQFSKFSLLVALNYFLTLVIVHSTVEFLRLPPLVGTLAAIIVTTVSNYLIAKFWVFQPALKPLNQQENL